MCKTLSSQEMIDTYTSTTYVVESQQAFNIRVACHSKELFHLYRKAGENSACFITAHNPLSVLLTTPHNLERQAELLKDIAALKLKFVYGYGQGNDSDWNEPSVLILGITYAESMELAVKHEQNAFIWCDEQAKPKIVLTR